LLDQTLDGQKYLSRLNVYDQMEAALLKKGKKK
jgi:hypothetical protein